MIACVARCALLTTALSGLSLAIPPIITRQPTHQKSLEGHRVFLEVEHNAPSHQTQWYKDDVLIEGANSNRLEFPNPQFRDCGSYQAKVISGTDATFSRVATLSIIPPKRAEGNLDANFFSGPLDAERLLTIAKDSQGRIYIGGQLNLVRSNNYFSQGIFRLLPDGQLDPSFQVHLTLENSSRLPEIRAIAIAQNEIVLAGVFTSCQGTPCNHLVRLNEDGDLIESYGDGANNEINALAVDPENRVLVGGAFTRFDGRRADSLFRLSADGSFDSTFSNPNFVGKVDAIDILHPQTSTQGTRYLIGGNFTNKLLRLRQDGSVETDFLAQTTTDVRRISALTNGQIVLALSRSPWLIRLLEDGVRDNTFQPGVKGEVFAIQEDRDNTLLIGGCFTRLNANVTGHRLVRLQSDGALDDSFCPPTPSDDIRALLRDDTGIIVAGDFTYPRQQVMRLKNVISPELPRVRCQDRDQTVILDHPLSLSVYLDDIPETEYQWTLNQQPLLGETLPTLQKNRVTESDEGVYQLQTSFRGFDIPSEPISVKIKPLTPGMPSRHRVSLDAPVPLDVQGSAEFSWTLPSLEIAHVRIHVDLIYPKINQLEALLLAPDGTTVKLFSFQGGFANDSENLRTTFDSQAGRTLDEGSAPWNGSWEPLDQSKFIQLQGFMPAGEWTLKIERDFLGFALEGELRDAFLEIENTAPQVTLAHWQNQFPGDSPRDFFFLRAAPKDLHVDRQQIHFSYRRWREETGIQYRYERLQRERWLDVSPQILDRKHFPGKQEEIRLRFPRSIGKDLIRIVAE